jgi:hypothetical protein
LIVFLHADGLLKQKFCLLLRNVNPKVLHRSVLFHLMQLITMNIIANASLVYTDFKKCSEIEKNSHLCASFGVKLTFCRSGQISLFNRAQPTPSQRKETHANRILNSVWHLTYLVLCPAFNSVHTKSINDQYFPRKYF